MSDNWGPSSSGGMGRGRGRGRGRGMRRDPDDPFYRSDDRLGRRDRSRSRSRSRSPDPDPWQQKSSSGSASKNEDPEISERERQRQARMARLRQENEEEERRLAAPLLDERDNAASRPEPTKEIIEVNQEELEGLDEEEQMKRLLGFSGGFGSTSGQKVEDNQSSAARGAAAKNKARKYRQYMNRKNGFNRPLDKMD